MRLGFWVFFLRLWGTSVKMEALTAISQKELYRLEGMARNVMKSDKKRGPTA